MHNFQDFFDFCIICGHWEALIQWTMHVDFANQAEIVFWPKLLSFCGCTARTKIDTLGFSMLFH